MKLLLVHARAFTKQVLFVENPWVERMSQRRGGDMELTSRRKVYQSKSQEEVGPIPVQVLSTNTATGKLLPQASLPPEISPPTEPPTFPSQPRPCKFPRHYSFHPGLFCCWLLKLKPFMVYISQR